MFGFPQKLTSSCWPIVGYCTWESILGLCPANIMNRMTINTGRFEGDFRRFSNVFSPQNVRYSNTALRFQYWRWGLLLIFKALDPFCLTDAGTRPCTRAPVRPSPCVQGRPALHPVAVVAISERLVSSYKVAINKPLRNKIWYDYGKEKRKCYVVSET